MTTHTHINNLSPTHHLGLFLSQANLADFGDNQWVTCFQETAEALLGHSAETLGHLRDTVRHIGGQENCLCNFARRFNCKRLLPVLPDVVFPLFFVSKDETAFDEVFQKANFTTHIFKNRVKLETYNVSG